MIKRDLLFRLIRFCVVGGVVTACFMGLDWLFGHWLSPAAAYLLSYPPTVGVHFSLNKWWTFGHRQENTHRQVGEYLLMVVLAGVLQWGAFSLLIAHTPLPSWLATGAASGAQILVTFLFMQHRVFRPAPAAASLP